MQTRYEKAGMMSGWLSRRVCSFCCGTGVFNQWGKGLLGLPASASVGF